MMSLSAYGRRIGVSHEAVRRAIKSGRLEQSITIDPKGHPKINDPDLADREWGAHTHATRQRDWKANGQAVSRAKGGNGASQSTGGSDGQGEEEAPSIGAHAGQGGVASQLNKAKAARETYEARISELKYKKMKDELVDATEVRQQYRDAGRRIRDGLLAIPDRITSIIAAETDPEKVRTTLIEEIEQTLTTLADNRGGDG